MNCNNTETSRKCRSDFYIQVFNLHRKKQIMDTNNNDNLQLKAKVLDMMKNIGNKVGTDIMKIARTVS